MPGIPRRNGEKIFVLLAIHYAKKACGVLFEEFCERASHLLSPFLFIC